MNSNLDNIALELSAEIKSSIETKDRLLNDESVRQKICQVADLAACAMANDKRLFFAGNGGSAADAQHLAAELVSRYEFDRPGLPSIALTTDTSILTAVSNDYGYETLFSRQLEALAREGDIFVGITTSGRSKNILAAFETCKKIGVTSVAFCGLGGELEGKADIVLRVPSSHTPRIQECHILIGHFLCGHIERAIFPELVPS